MKAIIVVCVIVAIAAIALYSVLTLQPPEEPAPIEPTPRQIAGVPYAYDVDDKVFVDVGEAADGNAEKQTSGSIEYDYDGYWMLFVPTGIFVGEPFGTQYHDEAEELRMHITDTLDPDNGVIEGWVAFNIKKDKLYASIFLDEDWKRKVQGTTRIIWGEEWNETDEYSWRAISRGIYMDEISFPADKYFARPYSSINLLVSNATMKFIDYPEMFKYVTGMSFA